MKFTDMISSKNADYETLAICEEAVMVKPAETLCKAAAVAEARSLPFAISNGSSSHSASRLSGREAAIAAYKHRDIAELLTVQPKGKDAKPYQIRKFLDMMEQFGLELDG